MIETKCCGSKNNTQTVPSTCCSKMQETKSEKEVLPPIPTGVISTELSGQISEKEYQTSGSKGKRLYIKQAVKMEDGTVEFSANLDEKEVAFLLELAINNLMRAGALPFAATNDDHSFVVESLNSQ